MANTSYWVGLCPDCESKVSEHLPKFHGQQTYNYATHDKCSMCRSDTWLHFYASNTPWVFLDGEKTVRDALSELAGNMQSSDLLRFANGILTIAEDLTLEEARTVIEELAQIVVSRGTMRELVIKSDGDE